MMKQPLEFITIGAMPSWRCVVPYCWGWCEKSRHRLCPFHEEFYGKQYGTPYEGEPGDNEAYYEHAQRDSSRVVFNLLMSSLWPGPGAKEKAAAARREKSLREKWNEERDD